MDDGTKLAHSELRENLDPIEFWLKAGELSAENGLELELGLKLLVDANGLNVAANGLLSVAIVVVWSPNIARLSELFCFKEIDFIYLISPP